MNAIPRDSSSPSPRPVSPSPAPPPASGLRLAAQAPGPRLLDMPAFVLGFGRDPLGTMARASARWGDIFTVPLPGEPVFALSHPALVEEVLLRRQSSFIKSRMTRDLSQLLGQGLLTSDGELWRRQRVMVSVPLQRGHIAHYVDDMRACTASHVARLQTGQVRDVHADMTELTLRIALRTLFGSELDGDAAEVGRLLSVAMRCFQQRWQTWRRLLPESVPLRLQRRLQAATRRLDRIVLRTIAQRREELAGSSRPTRRADLSLLSMLVQARDADGRAMDDAQLRDEAITFFLAGHETTALTLGYALYEIGRHPEVGARLRAELDAVLGQGRPVDLEALGALRYTEAVVRETLRLYPPAWAVGREATEPVELGGYPIPAGAQVIACQYLVQRDARWFESPRAFRPERWLSPPPPARPRFAWFPFGGGPRVCIGNHFAMTETVLVLAMLCRAFQWSHLEPADRVAPPSVTATVTLRPTGPMHMRVEHRAGRPEPRD